MGENSPLGSGASPGEVWPKVRTNQGKKLVCLFWNVLITGMSLVYKFKEFLWPPLQQQQPSPQPLQPMVSMGSIQTEDTRGSRRLPGFPWVPAFHLALPVVTCFPCCSAWLALRGRIRSEDAGRSIFYFNHIWLNLLQ